MGFICFWLWSFHLSPEIRKLCLCGYEEPVCCSSEFWWNIRFSLHSSEGIHLYLVKRNINIVPLLYYTLLSVALHQFVWYLSCFFSSFTKILQSSLSEHRGRYSGPFFFWGPVNSCGCLTRRWRMKQKITIISLPSCQQPDWQCDSGLWFQLNKRQRCVAGFSNFISSLGASAFTHLPSPHLRRPHAKINPENVRDEFLRKESGKKSLPAGECASSSSSTSSSLVGFWD